MIYIILSNGSEHKQQKIPMRKLKFNMLPSHDLNHMLRNNEFVVKKYGGGGGSPPPIYLFIPPIYTGFFSFTPVSQFLKIYILFLTKGQGAQSMNVSNN